MNKELFLEKDKEFIKFASKMEFSPKNYQIYFSIRRGLNENFSY